MGAQTNDLSIEMVTNGQILKVEQIRFPNRLNDECNRKRKYGFQGFELNN